MTFNYLFGARTTVAIGALVCGFAVASTPAVANPAGAVSVSEPSDVVPTAGATTVNIQQQIHLICVAGHCQGDFPALTAKQRLRLQKVVCFVSGRASGQKAIEAYVDYTSPLFYFNLAQRSHVSNSLAFDDLFDEDVAFDVPKGKTLEAIVRYNHSGSDLPPATSCTIYGQRITSP